MREIKFRAWTGEEMRFGGGEFFWLLATDSNYFELQDHRAENFDKVEAYNNHKDLQILNNADFEGTALMQYTGLKDKNGKEIYEGDVVEFMGDTTPILVCGFYNENHYKVGQKLVVRCLTSGFTLSNSKILNIDSPNIVGNVNNYEFWKHARSLKVIGNIYENPELIA